MATLGAVSIEDDHDIAQRLSADSDTIVILILLFTGTWSVC